jgi:L-threonylcarbamoyladenylate synthase
MAKTMTKLISTPEEAKRLLALHKLVAIPTETVYGLAADASSFQAIHQIYQLKQRPIDRTLALNIHPNWPINKWCQTAPAYVQKLIKRFWPGPLTLILKRNQKTDLLPMLIGSDDSLALRCPNHPLTLKLLELFQKPIVAPSANPSNELSATTVEQVANYFKTSDLAILDGGACELGMESTILKIIDEQQCEILRYGAISIEDIYQCIGFYPKEKPKVLEKTAIKSNFYYFETEKELRQVLTSHPNLQFGLIATEDIIKQHPHAKLSLNLPKNLKQRQKKFYELLIKASLYQNLRILIQSPPYSHEYLSLIQQIHKFANPISEL